MSEELFEANRLQNCDTFCYLLRCVWITNGVRIDFSTHNRLDLSILRVGGVIGV